MNVGSSDHVVTTMGLVPGLPLSLDVVTSLMVCWDRFDVSVVSLNYLETYFCSDLSRVLSCL